MRPALRLESLDADAMRRLGHLIGAHLRSTDVVSLEGDLGAGKTFLAGAIARGAGVPAETRVTSPTFTLLNVHVIAPRGAAAGAAGDGDGPGQAFHHLDLYRLEGQAGLDTLRSLGLLDYLPPEEGITVIEWLPLCPEAAPARYLRVAIEGAGDDPRSVLVEPMGGPASAFASASAPFDELLDEIVATLSPAPPTG